MWQFPLHKISDFSAEQMQARCCVLKVQNLAKKHRVHYPKRRLIHWIQDGFHVQLRLLYTVRLRAQLSRLRSNKHSQTYPLTLFSLPAFRDCHSLSTLVVQSKALTMPLY